MASIIPGEKNPNAPRVRKRNKYSGGGASGRNSKNTGPVPDGGVPSNDPVAIDKMPKDPSPASRYNKMKKAFATPGMQPGEKDTIAAIAKKRGVSPARAAEIGKMRTSKGLTTAGVSGPKGMTLKKPRGRISVDIPEKPSKPMPRPPYDPDRPRPKLPMVARKTSKGRPPKRPTGGA